MERSRARTLLSPNGRLPRWAARRSRQRQPGRGIHPGLPAFLGGNAVGAEHFDQFQRTARHSRNSRRYSFMTINRTTTILKPDQSRVLLRPFSPGGPERVARIIARI